MADRNKMQAARCAFAAILLVMPDTAFGETGSGGSEVPLRDYPSIFVQNRAFGRATVTLVAFDDTKCGESHVIASGEPIIIRLLCKAGPMKLRMYDFVSESWKYWPVFAERRYETLSNDGKWTVKDVTSELTR